MRKCFAILLTAALLLCAAPLAGFTAMDWPEIDFGHQLSGTVWKPGERRTYTLKTGDVDVVITDEVVDHVKSEVKITNVGNLPHYVRAMITAQWFGKDVTYEPKYHNSHMAMTDLTRESAF